MLVQTYNDLVSSPLAGSGSIFLFSFCRACSTTIIHQEPVTRLYATQHQQIEPIESPCLSAQDIRSRHHEILRPSSPSTNSCSRTTNKQHHNTSSLWPKLERQRIKIRHLPMQIRGSNLRPWNRRAWKPRISSRTWPGHSTEKGNERRLAGAGSRL